MQRPRTQHRQKRTEQPKPIVALWNQPLAARSVATVSPLHLGQRVSEQGLIQDLGPHSDVRKACTRQHEDMIELGELTKQVRDDVFVRSPRRSGLAKVLTRMGATVRAEPSWGLSVTGMDACGIASAAAAYYIPIQELTPCGVSSKGATPRRQGRSDPPSRNG
jgi:hypothetical protein